MHGIPTNQIVLVEEHKGAPNCEHVEGKYFKLTSHLKDIKDLEITRQEKEQDGLWRVRALIAQVLKGCHDVLRVEFVSIDEKIVPFIKISQLRQLVLRTPNPEGLKNFALSTSSGLILDF